MIFEKRIDVILKMLEAEKKVSNKKLLETLDISESTLRRDLDYLEEAGDIKRVHGGAVLNRVSEETNFKFNEGSNLNEKKIIGAKAAKLVNNGDLIFLDGGTTTHQIIEHLNDKDVTVVTNGLMHLDKLSSLGIKTFVLGGEIKMATFISYGENTIDEISRFNFDLAFIGANGIFDNRYSTADNHEASIKKAAIKKANKSYVLADKSKFDKKFFIDFATFYDAELITED